MEKDDIEIVVGGPNEQVSAEDQALINEAYGSIKPEDKQKPEPKPEVTPEADTGDDNDDGDDNDNDDNKLEAEHDDKTDDEREAIRERRRIERQNKKKFRTEKEDSYKREIETLRKQVGEMNEWKNTVESRRVQSGVAQLDKALSDSVEAIEIAKRAISDATTNGDGAALVDAQELYYAARKRVDDLGRVKQQLAQRQQQPPQQNIDPSIIKNAQSWMSGKDWYDPTGKNQDSRVALSIDNSMAEEGWDPRKPEYWTELDSRLKNYLPHRYNSGYTERNGDKTRPPTGGSSQSRGGASSSNFTLSPERVRAMKEAGMWEDSTKRQSMIRRYMEQDRNSKK